MINMINIDLLNSINYYGYGKCAKPIEFLNSSDRKEKDEITDLALVTGGTNEFMILNRAKMINGKIGARRIRVDKKDIVSELERRDGIIRPAIYSETIFEKLYPNAKNGEIEYGEYPQTAPNSEIQEKLEAEYNNHNLNATGNSYTFDSCENDEYNRKFCPISYEEYEFECKKYIRVKVNSSSKNKLIKLSNGLEYSNGDYVWIETEPIVWEMCDSRTYKVMFTKKGLLSGIRYNEKANGVNYLDSEVKFYLDNYMKKDLFQENVLCLDDLSIDELEKLKAEVFIGMLDKKKNYFDDLKGAYRNYFRKDIDDNELRKKVYSIIKLSEEFDLNETIQMYIMINFEELFNNYGYYKKVRKNQYINPNFYITDIDDNLDKNNEAYIRYFKEDFINILKNMFDDNKLSCSDQMNLGNASKYDFDLLSKQYPNIEISKIKDIVLRCDTEENVTRLLVFLNQKDEKYQEKVLEFINPIINYYINKNYNLISLKKYIHNEDSLNLEKNKYCEDINIYFLKEFENLFLNIFNAYAEDVDDKVLDKLLKIKDYVIQNIPKPSYENNYVEKIVGHEHKGLVIHKFCTPDIEINDYDYETLYERIKQITFHKEKVLNIKKSLLMIIPMIINNNINYKDLFYSGSDQDYIRELIEKNNNVSSKKKIKK